MISLNLNRASSITQSSLKSSSLNLSQAIERMSSGSKLNHAKDNAANYSIATNLTTKLSSYQIAQDNCLSALDMVMTAQSSLDNIYSHLSKMRSIVVQAMNAPYTTTIKSLQSELDANAGEINRLVENTKYDSIALLEGEPEDMGIFIEKVVRLSKEEALAQGYTLITTPEELQAVNDNLSGKYILMNNIDLEGYDWTPIADYEVTSEIFKGQLNGNGYVISNLTIDNPNKIYVGLFGCISSSATIENLGIENANVCGDQKVGIFAGASYNGTVRNCYTTGNVAGNNYVGGFGGMMHLNLENCYSSANVVARLYSGGFIGENYGTVNNCAALGTVTATVKNAIHVGGFIGRNYITTSNSYSMAKINVDSTATYVGGFIGSLGGSATEGINNYWDTEKSGVSVSAAGTGVSSEELQELISNGRLVSLIQPDMEYIATDFQVGIDSQIYSNVSLNISFALTIPSLNISGATQAEKSLLQLDDLIERVSAKQVEYGAAYNRLEGALETIEVNLDNLVSTRSTIQDADMSKITSQYIRYQILQEASATLMASAQNLQANTVLGLLQGL